MRRLPYVISLTALVLTACAAPTPSAGLGLRPTAPPRAATPQPASAEDAIAGLILAEGQAVVSQDLTTLMELWAADALITDAKHTPDNPNDDARWRGRDAIRDRYVVLVFPGNPQAAGAKDIKISMNGDQASAVSTTVIGQEISPSGDRWTFARREGRWWITGLTYNLEPK